jgi:hypothetical protein
LFSSASFLSFISADTTHFLDLGSFAFLMIRSLHATHQ